MKNFKKFFSIFLIGIFLSQSIILPVCASESASGTVWTPEQKLDYHVNNINKILADLIGIVIPNFSNGSIDSDLRAWITKTNWIQENMTYDEWVAHNLNIRYYNGSSGNADVTFSQDYVNALKDYVKNWVDTDTGFKYGYSFGVADYLKNFSSQDWFHKFIDFVSNNPDKIICCDYYANYIYVLDSDKPVELVASHYYSVDGSSVPSIRAYSNWQVLYTWKKYTYNHSESKYDYAGLVNLHSYISNIAARNSEKLPSAIVNGQYFLVQQNVTQYQIYNSVDAMKAATEGVQEYYVTDSYNTTNITGSYNTTTNIIGDTITSSDVVNYVNNYYVQNNSYPSAQDVSNYMNNYNGSGGGGSGGSGGGSGNDSPSWDFSFLGTIGKFIGDLIAGIGNIVAGILEGLTGLIDLFIGVENPETGEREGGLPTIIGKLIEHFLPFLPPEIVNLFKLSIILGLILGIVRLIRRG